MTEHRCDVDWLFGDLTPATLARMRREFQADRASATVCANGHLWTADTRVVNANGHRICRLCQREAQRQSRLRRKARAA